MHGRSRRFPDQGKLVAELSSERISRTGPGTSAVSWDRQGRALASLPRLSFVLACVNSQKLRFRFPCIDIRHLTAHAKAPLQEKFPIDLRTASSPPAQLVQLEGENEKILVVRFLFSLSLLFDHFLSTGCQFYQSRKESRNQFDSEADQEDVRIQLDASDLMRIARHDGRLAVGALTARSTAHRWAIAGSDDVLARMWGRGHGVDYPGWWMGG